jgi:GNAT superfamily N-acetyltransferase
VTPPTPSGYEISTDPALIDVKRLHRWLSEHAYWARGRSLDVVRRSLAGSLNFGLYRADGEMVGFARAVTDLATFGWLCDVYLEPAERGKGLGSWLVSTVRDHLHSHGIYRIILATWDAHDVYRRLGFTPLAKPDDYMELFSPLVPEVG